MLRLSLAVLGSLFSLAVHAGALDQPAVARYVQGWTARDGAQVQSAFASDGTYRDPSVMASLTRDELAAHVDKHRDATFSLREAKTAADGSIRLDWQIRWPDQRGASTFVDTLRLHDGAIRSVNSIGLADASGQRLMADYQVLHDDPTPERIAAAFTPDFAVYGRTLPPDGLHSDDYLPFLARMAGSRFTQNEGSQVLLTKDHRLVLYWTLKIGGAVRAGGVVFVTLRDGRMSKIVGIY